MAVNIGLIAVAAFGLFVAANATTAGELYRLGRPATPGEIAGWNIDIGPDGSGLPAGRGDVHEGEAIYERKCASCHGPKGEGHPMDRLVGGFGTIFEMKSQRTVGSFWPYATTLFDFVRRAMPLDAPQSLTADEVYALCAYILFLNRIVPEGATLDATSVPKIEMPNRAAFTSAYPSATDVRDTGGARAPKEER